MSGTFIIRPTILQSGGSPLIPFDDLTGGYEGWAENPNPVNPIIDSINELVSPGDNLSAVLGTTGVFSDTLRFAFTGASIYLDGSPTPIGFASLPAGFTPTTASVKIDPSIQAEESGAGVSSYHLQQSIGINGPVNNPVFDYDFTFPPSMLDIYSNGCGIIVSINASNPGDVAAVDPLLDLRVEGTYDIQNFSFQVQDINTPVHAGQSVSIISPSPSDPDHPLDLTTVDTITVVSPDEMTTVDVPSFTVTQDPITLIWILIFTWPVVPDDVPYWTIMATGTEFSGSVALGIRITIFFTNASGIYQLVPGKTSDTLYDVVDGTTIELAIPDPFFKTGYIGG